jgi:hypothetical protein
VLARRAIDPSRGEQGRDTWRNTRHELDRLHLVTLATSNGHVAQRSMLTAGQKKILTTLDLPEPPRFLNFTPG